jgi:TM2 domain-containing membrane protein YozV
MAEANVCPYCRMPFDDQGPPRVFCTACGTPHHEDCYYENGGCTVFGCARAPADDPKLQVSYSDLNAVAQQPSIATVREPAVATAPLFPSPYGGPLGLSHPGPAAAAPAQSPSPNASAQATVAAGSAYPQPAAAPAGVAKSRTTYIVLGVFLGALGAHNFYAGYTGRAVGQLCLSALTLGRLALASWIWAIVEICVVDKDSAGIKFS